MPADTQDMANAPQATPQTSDSVVGPTSEESRAAAQAISDSSDRRLDAPVRKAFVRSDASEVVPPLAQLFAGGRGGAVAIKLYLALIWRSSVPPYDTNRPNRAWAQLLDLPDPAGKGARRVADAMKSLEKAKLIRITPEPGSPNVITLLDEHGDGSPYSLPSSSYTAAAAKSRRVAKTLVARHVYFKVASSLWTQGYMQRLSGPALVMLLILLAEQAGEGKKVWFATESFPARYRISHKSRAAGTAELQRLRLLLVGRESLPDSPAGTVFDRRRFRNVYYLLGPARTGDSASVSAAFLKAVAEAGLDLTSFSA